MNTPRSEAEVLIAAVADVQSTSLPLATGLRMLAADLPQRRWSAALRALADEVERGVPLAAALERPTVAPLLPASLRGLLTSAAARGDLPNAATDVMEVCRTAREERQAFVRALTYPALVILLSLVVCVFFSYLITTYIEPMVNDFGLRQSSFVSSMYSTAHYIQSATLYGVPAAIGLIAAVRFFGGRSVSDGLWCEAPLLGPVLLWSATAEFLRSTAIYVEQQIPLPLALQWAAEAQSNYLLANEGRALARKVEQGLTAAEAWKRSPVLPQSLTPFLAKDGPAPSAATLRIAADLLSVRVGQRANVLTTILPPLAFIITAAIMLATVAAMMLPMMSLIRGLSGG